MKDATRYIDWRYCYAICSAGWFGCPSSFKHMRLSAEKRQESRIAAARAGGRRQVIVVPTAARNVRRRSRSASECGSRCRYVRCFNRNEFVAMSSVNQYTAQRGSPYQLNGRAEDIFQIRPQAREGSSCRRNTQHTAPVTAPRHRARVCYILLYAPGITMIGIFAPLR